MEKQIEMLKARENMYHFLSHLYILEVDKTLLSVIKKMKFPQNQNDLEIYKGYKVLEEYVENFNENNLDELAVDYASTFLAAGVAQGLAAFPYESVYTSKKRIVDQESCSSVKDMYAKSGVVLRENTPKVPEDHIAVEFDFMAYLCKIDDLKTQKLFFENHLFNWVLAFCSDVDKYAKTDFYKGLAKITAGYMNLEKEYLKSEAKLWDIN